MRNLITCLLTLCLSLPAFAERKQTFGDIDVHYSVFNSSFLQPDTAAASGLIRSKTQGVLTVSVLKDSTPLTAEVDGSVKNLLGQLTLIGMAPVGEAQDGSLDGQKGQRDGPEAARRQGKGATGCHGPRSANGMTVNYVIPGRRGFRMRKGLAARPGILLRAALLGRLNR